MKRVVTLRQMPPWSADPDRSVPFRNDPRLSDQDISIIQRWADAGAPLGNSSHPIDLQTAAAQWQGPNGREPDLVISMAHPAQIPASGDLPYVRFLAKNPLDDDRWIAACQARPGNAAVVHHMAVTEVEVPKGVSPADIDGMERLAHRMGGASTSVVKPLIGSATKPGLLDMLGIYTPGSDLETYPENAGKLLKGGGNYYLNFNIHYTSNGTPASDRSEIAFWFRKSPPERLILRSAMAADTVLANGVELLPEDPGEKAEGTHVAIPPISPGAANFELVSISGFPQPITIYQVHPHAHFRARDFRYVIVYPDGREQALLTVPQYDFRWQMEYDLQTPLDVPAGSKLVVTAHYDNSRDKRGNPAPDQTVRFRAQNMSTDEMFSPFMQFSENTQGTRVEIKEGSGCLVAVGDSGAWSLLQTETLATRGDSNPAQAIPLIGVSAFHPERLLQTRVSVKGLWSQNRWNVTSMRAMNNSCGQ